MGCGVGRWAVRLGRRLKARLKRRATGREAPWAVALVSKPWQVRALVQATAWLEALMQGGRKAGPKAQGEG